MGDLSDWKMVARTDEDYDLVAGGLVVELSRGSEFGKWTFWGVRFDGTENRIGAIDSTFPPEVVTMLDAKRAELLEATSEGER